MQFLILLRNSWFYFPFQQCKWAISNWFMCLVQFRLQVPRNDVVPMRMCLFCHVIIQDTFLLAGIISNIFTARYILKYPLRGTQCWPPSLCSISQKTLKIHLFLFTFSAMKVSCFKLIYSSVQINESKV